MDRLWIGYGSGAQETRQTGTYFVLYLTIVFSECECECECECEDSGTTVAM